jgi:hypothetical protein
VLLKYSSRCASTKFVCAHFRSDFCSWSFLQDDNAVECVVSQENVLSLREGDTTRLKGR